MTRDSVVSETTALVTASEETPLLQANSEVIKTHPELGHTNEAETQGHGSNGIIDEDDKPLPRTQIFLLCYCRMVEPIAFFSIFPFVTMMIQHTGGVKEEDVGFYSGLLESLFSFTQMLLMISWGRAADKIGRKPVLVFSLTGVAISMTLFGLSQKIWQMMFFRCLAGVFSGTVVTIRAMTTENSTPKTQARAFSFFAFAGNLGIIVGTSIGGALADPATQYGGIFARIQFFHDFPYALPSIVIGIIGLSAAVISALFIEETLKTKPSTSGTPAEPPPSIWEIIKSPGVPMVLFLFNYILLLGMAYTAVVPVFWFTSVERGGLGFTSLLISAFLALAGVSQALWTLLVFPPAQKRWGTGGVMRFCGIIWPISFIAAPLCNWFLRRGWRPAFWILLPLSSVLGSGAAMAFTCVQLALNDISPSPAVLGTLNAVALAMTSGIRAVAPALFASLFATGVKKQIFGGYLVWVILILMALGSTVAIRYLPEKAQGNLHKKRASEEDEA